jgi:hypothetical protein
MWKRIPLIDQTYYAKKPPSYNFVTNNCVIIKSWLAVKNELSRLYMQRAYYHIVITAAVEHTNLTHRKINKNTFPSFRLSTRAV